MIKISLSSGVPLPYQLLPPFAYRWTTIHWCGGCKMEMITRLYKYYESLPIENLPEEIGVINGADEVITFITEEPKKKGRKPKKNG